jgi:hypothetical protein
MNYTFADYERLLLERLAIMQAPWGPLAEMAGFAGQIVPSESGLLLVLLNRFPALLVEIREAEYTPGPYPYHTELVTAVLHVCCRSLRSQEEARGGDAGAFMLLAEVRRLLLGVKPAEDLQPLLLVNQSLAAAGLSEDNEHLVIYQARYNFTNPRIREGD